VRVCVCVCVVKASDRSIGEWPPLAVHRSDLGCHCYNCCFLLLESLERKGLLYKAILLYRSISFSNKQDGNQKEGRREVSRSTVHLFSYR
jgi:hypothetical protein